jgi:hypothetical protein
MRRSASFTYAQPTADPISRPAVSGMVSDETPTSAAGSWNHPYGAGHVSSPRVAGSEHSRHRDGRGRSADGRLGAQRRSPATGRSWPVALSYGTSVAMSICTGPRQQPVILNYLASRAGSGAVSAVRRSASGVIVLVAVLQRWAAVTLRHLYFLLGFRGTGHGISLTRIVLHPPLENL